MFVTWSGTHPSVIFAGKAAAYQIVEDWSLTLPSMTNTPAYYGIKLVTAKKKFYVSGRVSVQKVKACERERRRERGEREREERERERERERGERE